MHNHIKLLISCVLIAQSGIESKLVLSPSGLASICPGEELALVCSTNQADFLMWKVEFPIPVDENEITNSRSWLISKSDLSVIFNLSLGDDPFAFSISRNSEPKSLLLVSSLTITNVTASWNGTLVNCTESGAAAIRSTATATIKVVTSDIDYPRSTALKLNVSDVQHFGEESVVVFLQWSYESSTSVSYNIHIVPEAAAMFTQSIQSPFNLTIHYNAEYNVSIEATLCGQSLANSNTITLNYVSCGDPFHQPADFISILNYSVPALQGDTLSFVCYHKYILTGPNMSTCRENGEWEPDPRDIKCIPDCGDLSNDTVIGVVYNSTLEGSSLVFWCQDLPNKINIASCQRNASWSPNPNSVCLNHRDSGIHVNLISVFVSVPLIVGMTLILVVGVYAAILLIRSKRGPKQKRKLITTNAYSHHNRNTGQISSTCQEAGGQKRLFYADIGPISSAKTHTHVSVIHDDDRVDYAQVITMHEAIQQRSSKLEKNKNTGYLDNLLNLDTLLLQLQNKATPKWYQFGEAVGIDKETLNKYTKYPNDQCIIEVLDYWLRNHTQGQPTWREVAGVLRGIDLQQLASDIERVYETGKLPIDIDKISQEMFLESATELPPPVPPRD